MHNYKVGSLAHIPCASWVGGASVPQCPPSRHRLAELGPSGIAPSAKALGEVGTDCERLLLGREEVTSRHTSLATAYAGKGQSHLVARKGETEILVNGTNLNQMELNIFSYYLVSGF